MYAEWRLGKIFPDHGHYIQRYMIDPVVKWAWYQICLPLQ